MLSALRRRLTVTFTALTALVLAGALAATWYLTCSQYRTSGEALFDRTLAALCDRLADAGSVADRWLTEQESASQCAIFVQDGSEPLHFPGAVTLRTDRAALLAQANAAALDAGLNPANRGSDGAVTRQTVYFTLTGQQGERYQCAAALLPRGRGGAYLLLTLAQDTSYLGQYRLRTALQYAGLFLLGTAALAAISWFLAGKALEPTRRAMQRQNEFVAAASHELRSPLAVIKTSLTAAQAPEVPDAQRPALLRAAVREADRMARLVDDLLLLAGSDANALPVQLAPVETDTLCIEVYEQFYLLARQRGHALTLTLPDGPAPAAPADAERLRQLLGILVNNALDHTPPGTPVELLLEVPEGKKASVTLAVADHGPGIPDAEKERVFDRFYRADQSRADKAHFGLGLSVAAELARLHSARLTLTDTPGGGLTVRLTLPAAEEG